MGKVGPHWRTCHTKLFVLVTETLEEPPGDHRHRLQDSSVKGSEESSESDHQKVGPN